MTTLTAALLAGAVLNLLLVILLFWLLVAIRDILKDIRRDIHTLSILSSHNAQGISISPNRKGLNPSFKGTPVQSPSGNEPIFMGKPISVYIYALYDGDALLYEDAVAAIKRYKPQSQIAIEGLTNLIGNDRLSKSLRQEATEALEMLGATDAIAELVKKGLLR